MKALVIGGVSLDTIIHIDQLNEIRDDMSIWANNIFKSIGGTGAGKALALSTLGIETCLITILGNDEPNIEIREYFANKKLKFKAFRADETTTHTNIMHSNGKRLSIFTTFPKENPYFDEEEAEKMILDSDIVFLNIDDFCRKYIPLLKLHKKTVVVDIHDYNPPNPYHQDFIDVADYLITSGINIKNQLDFLKSSIDSGKKVSIITLGDKGLIAMDDNGISYTVEAFDGFEYIDSNGAGDSFCVGFIVKLFESNDIMLALEFGNMCGAIACTSRDLYNLEYTKDKIEKLMQNKKS